MHSVQLADGQGRPSLGCSIIGSMRLQVPQALGNPGFLPPGYVTFAKTDPDNLCVIPNGNYRARSPSPACCFARRLPIRQC